MSGFRIVAFLVITFVLLFYPGNSWIVHTFLQKPQLYTLAETKKYAMDPIPVISSTPVPYVSAEGIFITDLTSFSPLFEKNSRNKFFPASTAKIITALVVVDVFQPNDIVTVRRAITKEEEPDWQLMGLVTGERITVENLLYGILVHSANDAAIILANTYGYDNFIMKMNEKAKELHMENTHFVNPDGIDEQGQLTSPYDLALAARALLKNQYLAKFVSTKEITISDVDYTRFHKLSNVNQLLGEVNGIGGLKTGYTELAGENLVSFYKKNGHQYIIVVMKSVDRFEDTRRLTQWIDQSITFVPMPTY